MDPNIEYSVKGGKNNKYCADEGGRIICDRNAIGGWEKFKIEKQANSNEFAIRGGKDNKYCADEGDKITCNRDAIGGLERFKIENLNDGRIAIRGSKDNKYCADEGDKVICNRDSITQDEKFKVFKTIKNVELKTKIVGKLKQISSDIKNTCGVNSSDEIFCKLNNQPGGDVWNNIKGSLKHISTHNGKLYGVNKDEEIFYADDLNNVVWQNVSGNFISLNQVSMHGNKVCGVTRYGATFCKNNLTGKNWFKLPLKVPLKHVSLFKDKLMGVSYDNDLIKTDNIYDPLSWQFMSNEDKFKQVDINEHGYCGINMDNNIMCNINYNDQGGVKLITGGDKKWKYVDSKNGINGIQDNDDIYFTR